MLDQKLAEAMQRVLAKDEERFTLTKALEELIEFGIGTRRGKSAYFTSKDKDEIRAWLEAKGFSVDQRVQPGMTRSERLAITPNEKAGGEAIKRHRVSIKALAGQPLVIGQQRLQLPPESHLDIDWTKVVGQTGHTCILVVENYENFNRIHETQFNLPDAFLSPLVVYRGDPNESRIDNVLKFLAEAKLPVLAFMDADPAGIAIASQFPNLAGMVFPPIDILEKLLRNPRTARKDLFLDQYPVYGSMLDALPAGHPCQAAWKLISRVAAGVVQERWVNSIIYCSF
jgi:hypothetical protein